MKLEGYKQIKIAELKKLIDAKRMAVEHSNIEIATKLNVRSSTTVYNCYNDPAKVSDVVFIKYLSIINIDCLILISVNKKMYFIKES